MRNAASPVSARHVPPLVLGDRLVPVAQDPAARKRWAHPRTAFVLSGGASLGALQVGMLRALYERGVAPDLLVGTSVGALNAAFVASRPQSVETADELAAVWRALRREEVFPVGFRALARGLAGNGDHLIDDRGLRAIVERHLELERIEQAVVPLHLVTFDLVSGEEFRISSGPAVDAVLAAAAIPGVLPSVRWGDRKLVDGAVVDNTPISHAVELGAERVYVLSTSSTSRGLARPPRGALEAALHGIKLMVDANLRSEVERHASQVELIVLPAPNPGHVQQIDFRHSSSLIERALYAARAHLASSAAAFEPRA